MNMLFIESELNPSGGGVQRVSNVLGEGLRKRGYGVWYAYHNASSDTKEIADAHKVHFDYSSSAESLYDVFKTFIKENQIDILFVQNVYHSHAIECYHRLKKELGVKVVCCLHCNPDMTVNKNSLLCTPLRVYLKDIAKDIYYLIRGDRLKMQMKAGYEVADKYVLLSERFIPIFKSIVKTGDITKLVGINNPCSFPDFTQTADREKTLLVVSRMAEHQKRISNILRMWRHIHARHKDWKLVIVGGGPDLERYQRYANSHKLPRVTFVGQSSEVKEYYQKSAIFCMSSIWEGFGMTLVESQSQGCVPVVIDNFAAVHDIIDGTNGLVTKSNDLPAFEKEIEHLIDNPDVLAEMSKKGIKTSRTNFALDKILDKWEGLFCELNNVIND